VEKQIEQEIEQKKKLPEEIRKKIFKKTFVNYIVSSAVLVYVLAIMLGNRYLEQDVFVLISRILVFVTLLTTIVLFEISYKRADKTYSGTLAMYGIELLVLTVFTLFIPHIFYELSQTMETNIIVGAIYSVLYYYFIKTIAIYKYEEKKHKETLSDVKDIVKKEKKK